MMKKLKQQYKRDTSRPNYVPQRSQSSGKRNRYGAIDGIEVGRIFRSRKECCDAGVHGVMYQGIHSAPTGAYSVCLSGVYEDDIDEGDVFGYTGTGGKNAMSSSSKHVEDQTFSNPQNKSLKISSQLKRPVRVVRGPYKDSKWAPDKGIRYDGLYQVVNYFYDKGVDGRRVCKFTFRRLPGQPPLPEKPEIGSSSP